MDLPFETSSIDVFYFAVNIAFPFALLVFVIGTTYKLARFVSLRAPGVSRSRPRERGFKFKIISLIKTFVDPIILSLKYNPLDFVFGLLLLHLLGTIPLLFLLGQHISFFQYYFKLYGILWPLALPISPSSPATVSFELPFPFSSSQPTGTIWGPLTVILNGDVFSVSITVAIAYKLADKIHAYRKGVRSVRPWDITSLFLLLGIVWTGFFAAHHLVGLPGTIQYRNMLGLHILLADLLLLSIPFTNMWHITFSYIYGKLHEYWDLRLRKGVE